MTRIAGPVTLAILSLWLFASPPRSEAFDVSDAASRFDRAMAVFDPVGRYVRRPVERQIPNLVLKGFLRQWTDLLLEEDGQELFREQDFRFLQIQNLLEVESMLHLAPGLDVFGVSHFLYDGVYDAQDADGLFADRIDRTAEVYHDFERIVRELYLSYRTHRFDFAVGKQQIAWGKMDGQFIDIVNAMDRREAVQLETEDFEWRRLPTWLATGTYYVGQNSLQLLYVFDFEEDRQPLPGSPWAFPVVPPPELLGYDVRPAKRPGTGDFGDHEYGARLDLETAGLTWGLIYFYGWDKNPVERVVGTRVEGEETLLVLEPRHERLHQVGATADYATSLPPLPLVGALPGVFRTETLYSEGVRIADFAAREEARAGRPTSATVTRDTVRAAVAAEFAFPWTTTVIFQPSLYYTLDWEETFGPAFGGGFQDEWSLLPVFYVSRPFAFTRDRLSVQLTVFPLLSGPERDWQGIKTKLRWIYKVSQFVTVQLVYNGYDGGNATDLYGQYDAWDNFGWELSYEF